MYKIMRILVFVIVFYIQQVLQSPVDRSIRGLTLITEFMQFNHSKSDHRNVDRLKFNNNKRRNSVSLKAVELKDLDSTVHEKLSGTHEILDTTFNVGTNLISKHNRERLRKLPISYYIKEGKITTKEKIVQSTTFSKDNGGISSESLTTNKSNRNTSYLLDNKTIKVASVKNNKLTKPTKFSNMINTIKRILSSIYDEITAPVVSEKKSSRQTPDNATNKNITKRLIYNEMNPEFKQTEPKITPFVDTNLTDRLLSGGNKTMKKTSSSRSKTSRIKEINFVNEAISKKRSKQILSNDTFLKDSFLTKEILEAIATEKPPCEGCESTESNHKVPSCKDAWSGKDAHRCKIIVKQGMCDFKNVEKYCQKSCGFCKIPSPPKCSKTQFGCCWDKQTAKADTDGTNCRSCKNQYKHICTNFKSDCLSTKGPGDFMRHHCPETCGVCSGVCRDRPKSAFYCPFWKKDLKWCETRRDLMKHFCPVTCNLC